MAFPSTGVIEVRTTGSDTQCAGGFNSARGGTDYSQQNAAQATGTVTSSTTTVTATTGIFTSQMVGNYITDGTTTKEITAFTSSTVVTVDSAPSWTAATIYVGGALASPGKGMSIFVASNKLWIKPGTYAITSTSSNVSGGVVSIAVSGTEGAPSAIEGYSSVRGDLGAKPVLQLQASLTGSAIAIVSLAGGRCYVRNIEVDCNTGNTSAKGFLLTSFYCHVQFCRVRNATVIGIDDFSDGRNTILACEVINSSGTAGIKSVASLVACVVRDGTCTGIISDQAATATYCLVYNLSGGSSDGFQGVGNGTTYVDCTAYNCGRDGLRDNSNGVRAINFLGYGNGGYGINLQGNLLSVILNCAAGSNTSGNVSNTANASLISPAVVALSADPFTSKSTGDFSLNTTAGGGAACRAAGYPGAFPGGTTTGYLDIGAVQHADPAGGGGGGLLLHGGMQGGLRG